ncbi:MAG: APC family permease [Candidatus Fimivivens sp.]|nr:APC family permease [Candidatus Fimivivens sp.]
MNSTSASSERVLGRLDLIAIAVGNVIGGGIMSVVGVAIGLTGRSVVFALVLCSLMTLVSILPNIFASATIRMNGGVYTLAALLGGKFFAGVYIAFWLTNFFGASLYCTSFSQYMLTFVPGLNFKAVAITILTIIFLLNLRGIKVAAKAQNIMVVVLIVALMLFSFFGFSHVAPGFFEQPDFVRNGWFGIMYAAALMNFACGGAGFIVNFGRHSKNPTRDIPIAIVIASIVVTVIYAMVAVVAAGVLPISEVEGQSLALVAYQVLPYPLYLFFMIGGAMIALVTSLNALMGWLPPPVVQACHDGWLPKKFGALNEKYNTPHWVLLFVYIMATLILLMGWDIDAIATLGTFLSNAGTIIVVLTLIRLPDVVPDLWEKSMFHINNTLYRIICLAGCGMCIVFEYFLFDILNSWQKIGIIAYTILAVIYAFTLTHIKKGERIQIEMSYEEA